MCKPEGRKEAGLWKNILYHSSKLTLSDQDPVRASGDSMVLKVI